MARAASARSSAASRYRLKGGRSDGRAGRLRRDGGGRGAAMIAWAVARARGCVLVQLTTDKRRLDAHRFYRRLGFEATHEGMKLVL